MTRLVARLLALFRRRQLDAELSDELSAHLEFATAENLARGLSAEDAQRAAAVEFGGTLQTAEAYRDQRGFPLLDSLAQDLRYALRGMRRSPGFTAAAVGMLALGIGINAAVFTIVNAALFEGWPLVRENHRIVQLTTTKGPVYYPDFEEWRAQATSFVGMALVRGVPCTLNDGGNTPETYFATQVTANTFRLLGVTPMLGRDFSSSDESPGAAPVIALSYGVWSRRFGANPAIVGRTVQLDGLPATVIGVMPQRFSFQHPMNQDLWTVLKPTPAALGRDVFYAPFAFARMADGVTIEHARAQMETVGRRLTNAYPRTNRGVVPVVTGFEEWFVGDNARMLYEVTWGAVGLVLLIICANVVNLSLERAAGRSREISIRLALGAGRGRIVRQFLIESLVLSTLGGAIGWWLAKAGVRTYAAAQGSADVFGFPMDDRVLAYCIASAIVTGLLAGVATAMHLTKGNIGGAYRDDRRKTSMGRHGRRVSGWFVSVQMVLAVTLLASAGVILRSYLKVYAADIGTDTGHVLSMSLGIPLERYPNAEAWTSFYRDLATRLEALPGVVSVGFGAPPTENISRVAYELADVSTVDGQPPPTVSATVVSTGYFRTLGARVISGRQFDESDRASRLPVAIINQQFASRNWPGEAPVGKRLRLFRGTSTTEMSPWLTVVGVVSNIVQNDRTRQTFDPLVYVPFSQRPGQYMFAFVRTSGAPGSLAVAVRRQIYAMDPVLPVPVLMPLAERLDRAYAFERNVTALLVSFAAVALLVASVGLYATISHSVTGRVQEIGIRMAVGAQRVDILSLVFKQGLPPVGIGLALGLVVSLAANRIVKSQLVGVSPADPAALAIASVVLVVFAALGCWIPARRATRVNPVVALRHD